MANSEFTLHLIFPQSAVASCKLGVTPTDLNDHDLVYAVREVQAKHKGLKFDVIKKHLKQKYSHENSDFLSMLRNIS